VTEARSTLDDLVERTPAHRDRVVDAARAGSVVVVALWHWSLSVTHRDADGVLVMPNPIDTVPGSWLLTWLLQVMPVFFLVGGYAHHVAWHAARRDGVATGDFVRARLRRLFLPTAVWAACLGALEVLTALTTPGPHRWVWAEFPGLVAPLWFLAAYAALTVLVPVTVPLHDRHGPAVLGALVGALVLGGVLHRATGSTVLGWATAAVVGVLVHQLGHLWRTADLGHATLPVRAAVAGVGLAGLALLTTAAGYPRSMVSTSDGAPSNMLPPNATVVALAVLQLGVLALATPWLERVLRRPRLWRPVVAVNAVAMTIYVWHMTAYLVVLRGYEALGGRLGAVPDAGWWAGRWFWVVAPALVLAAVVAVVGRVEVASRRPAGRT
jgi:hypothetical protein